MSSGFVTSARTATWPSSAASFSTPAPSTSASTSFAPSPASRRAHAAPMPRAAPVISTVRPDIAVMASLLPVDVPSRHAQQLPELLQLGPRHVGALPDPRVDVGRVVLDGPAHAGEDLQELPRLAVGLLLHERPAHTPDGPDHRAVDLHERGHGGDHLRPGRRGGGLELVNE